MTETDSTLWITLKAAVALLKTYGVVYSVDHFRREFVTAGYVPVWTPPPGFPKPRRILVLKDAVLRLATGQKAG